MIPRPQVEPKVAAATGAGTATALIVWLLTHYVFHGTLPSAVEAAVQVIVPMAGTFVAGYSARHVDRTKEGTTMSVLTQIEQVLEDLRSKVLGKVGTEVSDDIHVIVDQAKAEASTLLAEAGRAAAGVAEQAVGDVAQVATDTAAAVSAPPVEAAPAVPDQPAPTQG